VDARLRVRKFGHDTPIAVGDLLHDALPILLSTSTVTVFCEITWNSLRQTIRRHCSRPFGRSGPSPVRVERRLWGHLHEGHDAVRLIRSFRTVSAGLGEGDCGWRLRRSPHDQWQPQADEDRGQRRRRRRAFHRFFAANARAAPPVPRFKEGRNPRAKPPVDRKSGALSGQASCHVRC
jgi:hypothetical protein